MKETPAQKADAFSTSGVEGAVRRGGVMEKLIGYTPVPAGVVSSDSSVSAVKKSSIVISPFVRVMSFFQKRLCGWRIPDSQFDIAEGVTPTFFATSYTLSPFFNLQALSFWPIIVHLLLFTKYTLIVNKGQGGTLLVFDFSHRGSKKLWEKRV